jgi:hypothetical protein
LTKIEKDLHEVTKALQAEEDGETVSPERLAVETQELKKRIEFLQPAVKLELAWTKPRLHQPYQPSMNLITLRLPNSSVSSKTHLAEAEAIVKAEESRSVSPSSALFGAYPHPRFNSHRYSKKRS